MTQEQEAIVVYLRRKFFVPLDDLTAVTKEFICADASRSGVDRCLRRHGLGNLRQMRPAAAPEPAKTFKAYDPGFVHIDIKYLPQMADETQCAELGIEHHLTKPRTPRTNGMVERFNGRIAEPVTT